MEGHHNLHQQHQHRPPPPPPPQQQLISSVVNVDTATTDRFPQWSVQETQEFLLIRSELDRTFMETKRNKLLWEVISNQMKEKGYTRSPDQCKCKWKNLVTRYKGCETMDSEVMKQQFPYYNEMQAIFANRMQRMLWEETERGGSASGSKKTIGGIHLLSSEDEDENEDISEGDKLVGGSTRKKRKGKSTSFIADRTTSGDHSKGLKDVLEDYMKQQMQMEAQWNDAYETREKERRMKEMEWRQRMEALENERLLMERRWMEKEEQWRAREEVRAEKRDALITTLLNKLRRQDHGNM